MTINRRSFLSTAAALPVVAAAPAVAAIAPEAGLIEGAAARVTPKHAWSWWYSYDGGDIFNEQFQSEEEAVSYLLSQGEGLVAQCIQQDFDLTVDGGTVLEMLCDQNSHQIGDGDFISATREQERELTRLLTAVTHAWAKKHAIDLTAWTFAEVKDKKEFPVSQAHPEP